MAEATELLASVARWSAEDLRAAFKDIASAPVPEPCRPVTGFVIDSRRVTPGSVFVALPGEKVDGRQFLPQAAASGAALAIVPKGGSVPDLPCVETEDPLAALQAAARYRRLLTSAKVLAVTGSVGKTGTKEMLAFLLSHLGVCHATAGNYNNHIGLPLTLANLPEDAHFCVLEAGMNHTGELTLLSGIARPHLAAVTSVQPAHLANFNGPEGVAHAKAEIFDGQNEDGIGVIGVDHPYTDILLNAARAKGLRRIITAGENEAADARLLDFLPGFPESTVGARIGGERVVFRTGLPGRHLAANAVLTLACLEALHLPFKDLMPRLQDMRPGPGRGEITQGNGGALIVDECYNASPASVKAALRAARANFPDRTLCLALGDMLELSDTPEPFYRDIAAVISEARVNTVVTVGADSACLRRLAPTGTDVLSYPDADTAAAALRKISPGDNEVWIVKGSRGMRTEKLLPALKERGGNETAA